MLNAGRDRLVDTVVKILRECRIESPPSRFPFYFLAELSNIRAVNSVYEFEHPREFRFVESTYHLQQKLKYYKHFPFDCSDGVDILRNSYRSYLRHTLIYVITRLDTIFILRNYHKLIIKWSWFTYIFFIRILQEYKIDRNVIILIHFLSRLSRYQWIALN